MTSKLLVVAGVVLIAIGVCAWMYSSPADVQIVEHPVYELNGDVTGAITAAHAASCASLSSDVGITAEETAIRVTSAYVSGQKAASVANNAARMFLSEGAGPGAEEVSRQVVA